MKKNISHTHVAYGRPRAGKPVAPRENQSAARWVLILGTAALVCFCGVQIRHGMREQEIPADAVSVMAVREVTSDSRVRTPTDSTPGGYLDGEWNLWEYLSDVLSALFLS